MFDAEYAELLMMGENAARRIKQTRRHVSDNRQEDVVKLLYDTQRECRENRRKRENMQNKEILESLSYTLKHSQTLEDIYSLGQQRYAFCHPDGHLEHASALERYIINGNILLDAFGGAYLCKTVLANGIPDSARKLVIPLSQNDIFHHYSTNLQSIPSPDDKCVHCNTGWTLENVDDTKHFVEYYEVPAEPYIGKAVYVMEWDLGVKANLFDSAIITNVNQVITEEHKNISCYKRRLAHMSCEKIIKRNTHLNAFRKVFLDIFAFAIPENIEHANLEENPCFRFTTEKGKFLVWKRRSVIMVTREEAPHGCEEAVTGYTELAAVLQQMIR